MIDVINEITKPIFQNDFQIKSRVIEKNIGHVFDVDIGDVNNDGKPDLLVTVNGINNGAVYVYEIPDDFRWIISINNKM